MCALLPLEFDAQFDAVGKNALEFTRGVKVRSLAEVNAIADVCSKTTFATQMSVFPETKRVVIRKSVGNGRR